MLKEKRNGKKDGTKTWDGEKTKTCGVEVWFLIEKTSGLPGQRKRLFSWIRHIFHEVRLSPKGKHRFPSVSLKPCWTGLISGWVTISIKYPVLYSLGSQAGVADINHAFHLYYNVVCGLSFSRSQPDFEGFVRALRFPSSAKLTPRA